MTAKVRKEAAEKLNEAVSKANQKAIEAMIDNTSLNDTAIANMLNVEVSQVEKVRKSRK